MLAVALVAFALAAPGPSAVAKDKGNKGKSDKAHKHEGKGHKADKVVVTETGRGRRVVIVDADRRAARDWWRSTYGRECPPGLAKKNNGCLPPGQAKKRYVVGQRLPSGILIKSVPTGLRLSAVPTGYRYAYVDGDVLLIETSTRLVADVIENLID
jgi:hypothetical protein